MASASKVQALVLALGAALTIFSIVLKLKKKIIIVIIIN